VVVPLPPSGDYCNDGACQVPILLDVHLFRTPDSPVSGWLQVAAGYNKNTYSKGCFNFYPGG